MPPHETGPNRQHPRGCQWGQEEERQPAPEHTSACRNKTKPNDLMLGNKYFYSILGGSFDKPFKTKGYLVSQSQNGMSL